MKKTMIAILVVGLLLMNLSAVAATYLYFTGNCNVRSGPGMNYSILGSVNKGSKLDYYGSTKYDDRGIAWYSVLFGDNKGWVSSVYASFLNEDGEATYGSGGQDSGKSGYHDSHDDDLVYYVEATAGDTHVRSGPGLKYASLDVMRRGTRAEYAYDIVYDDRDIAWYAVYWGSRLAWVSSVYTELYCEELNNGDELIGEWTMTEVRKKYNDVIQFDINVISVQHNGTVTLDWGDSGRIRGSWDETRQALTVHGNQVYILFDGVLGGGNEKYSGTATRDEGLSDFFQKSIVGSWLMTEYRKDVNDDVIQFEFEVISIDKLGNAVLDWGDSGRIRGKWNSGNKTLTVFDSQVYILRDDVLGGGSDRYSGVAFRLDA